MAYSKINIHSQIIADTHSIVCCEQFTLLLHKNADLPWFIIVPVTDSEDFLSLPADFRNVLVQASADVAEFIKVELGFTKINFASIGNVVSQLHLHVVGRKKGDVVWPAPVWGNLTTESRYATSQVEQFKRTILKYLNAHEAQQ